MVDIKDLENVYEVEEFCFEYEGKMIDVFCY